MSQLVNWWVAGPTTAAAVVSAWYIYQTYRVYRRIHQTMKQANHISRTMVRVSRRNLEDQHAPLLDIHFNDYGDGEKKDHVTKWRLRNIGSGTALNLKIFRRSDPELFTYEIGDVPYLRVDEERIMYLEHPQRFKPSVDLVKRFTVVAAYFDAFGNRWVSRFEGGRFMGAERLEGGGEGEAVLSDSEDTGADGWLQRGDRRKEL